MQPSSLHDRSYGYNAPKRQRSDSDYNSQTSQHIASTPLVQYGNQPHSGQFQQASPTGQPESYGSLLRQSHSQTTSMSQYPRYAQQEPLSAPVGGIAPFSYFGSIGAMAPGQREYGSAYSTQQHAPQYSARSTEDPSATLGGYSIPSTLAEAGLPPHQQHVYSHQGMGLPTSIASTDPGLPSYSMQYHQHPANTQSYSSFRTPLANPPVPGYETRVQHVVPGEAQDQQPQPRSARPYEQSDFADGHELFHEPAGNGSFSDNAIPLTTGILNREFIPSYGSQGHEAESDAPEFKDQPYPTPH